MTDRDKLITFVSNRMMDLSEQFVSTRRFAEHIGYDQSVVQSWISGRNLPSLHSAYDICKKMGVSLNWLVGMEEIDELLIRQGLDGIRDDLEKLEEGLGK